MALTPITQLPDYPDPDSTDFEANIGPWAAALTDMTAEVQGMVDEINGGAIELAGGTIAGPLDQVQTGSANFYGFYRTDSDPGTLAGIMFRQFGGAGNGVGIYGVDYTGAIGSQIARIDPGGTSMPLVSTLATREKGDARWAAISSARFKDGISQLTVTQAEAKALLDLLIPKGWTWGGELPDSDERRGTAGMGLVLEDFAAHLPEAVRYIDGKPHGIDPMPIIALMLIERGDIEARLAALEA